MKLLYLYSNDEHAVDMMTDGNLQLHNGKR